MGCLQTHWMVTSQIVKVKSELFTLTYFPSSGSSEALLGKLLKIFNRRGRNHLSEIDPYIFSLVLGPILAI